MTATSELILRQIKIASRHIIMLILFYYYNYYLKKKSRINVKYIIYINFKKKILYNFYKKLYTQLSIDLTQIL